MTSYRIAEIFSSVNGEGPRVGQLALFIRFRGCNLNCNYCDTEWAKAVDGPCSYSTVDEIVDLCRTMSIKNITLTGGEPLMQEGMVELIAAIAAIPDRVVEIETNGSLDLAPYSVIAENVHFTMDYKLPKSGMEDQMCLDNFQYLGKDDSIKFVVGDQEDLYRAKEIMDRYGLIGKTRVYLSPVYDEIEPEEIVNFMKQHQLNDVNLQIQIHKIIWDPHMRGV